MQRYNGELVKAGVLLAAEGLAASSKGAHVKFSGDKRIVIDSEVAGRSDRVGEARSEHLSNGEAEVEIRKVMEVEDFGEAFTPNPEIAKVEIK
jgi:hypothetical protein